MPGTTEIGNIVGTDAFSDTYSFEVASSASFASELVSIVFGAIFSINNFDASLWEGGVSIADDVQTTDSDGTIRSQLSFSPLDSASAYELRVTGTGIGEFGGVYKGTIAVAPVPEPEIYAMMVVGMGVMGWAARRKKRKQAAA